MTLIESMMSPCTRLVRVATPDDYLGHRTRWEDGETFQAAVLKGKQPPVLEAERPDAAEEYTVVTYTSTALSFDDVFRRQSDGAVFRVTGYSRDAAPPPMSTVQICKVPAERWDLIE